MKRRDFFIKAIELMVFYQCDLKDIKYSKNKQYGIKELNIVDFKPIDGIAWYIEIWDNDLLLIGSPINEYDDEGNPLDWDNKYCSKLSKTKILNYKASYIAKKMYEQYKLYKSN